MLCWFLPYKKVNESSVYMCPLPLEPPSHPHPILPLQVAIYTQPCVKQIASGKLLYNTGSSTQYYMTIQMDGIGWGVGRRFKREGTCVYLWLIHVFVWQKPTQNCKAIIPQLKKNQHFLSPKLASFWTGISTISSPGSPVCQSQIWELLSLQNPE